MKAILKGNTLEKILFVFLCIQILLIAYANFFLMEKNIDCDSAKLFVHAIEMWRNGTPIIPEWTGVSTLELDCSTLLAVPLFGLTQNIYISYAVSNIILLVTLICSIFYLFENESRKTYPLLSAILICIPYRIGMLDYFNMMYFNGSQYIIKVMIPLLLLSLLVHVDVIKNEKKNLIKFCFFSIICGILIFVSVLSSGVYVVLCGIVPVIGGSLIWRIFKDKKISMGYIFTIGGATVISIIGYLLNQFFEIGAKGNSMKLCNIYDGLMDNINACLLSIFEVFGGVAYSDIEVMSYEGINIIIRIFYVIILIVCVMAAFRRMLKKEGEEFTAVLLLLFIWNTFILCVCDIRYGAGTFEYRYHLIGLIPILCLSSKIVIEWIASYRKRLQVTLGVFGMCLIMIMMATSYRSIFSTEDKNSVCRDICTYAESQGVDYVYFLYESEAPEICRLIDHNNAIYLQLMEGGITWVYDYYKIYDHAPMIQENFIIICDNATHDFGDNMEMFGYVFTRSQIIGNKSVYEVTGFVQ